MRPFRMYLYLHSIRKGWAHSVPRWADEDMAKFGITPTPFGCWLLMNTHPADNGYSLLSYERKMWADLRMADRWIRDFSQRWETE